MLPITIVNTMMQVVWLLGDKLCRGAI
jgi:hypothetical protein